MDSRTAGYDSCFVIHDSGIFWRPALIHHQPLVEHAAELVFRQHAEHGLADQSAGITVFYFSSAELPEMPDVAGMAVIHFRLHFPAGQHHAGGDAPGQKHPRYARWISRYKALHDALADGGVRLVNCSRVSAIPAEDVPRLALEALLAR